MLCIWEVYGTDSGSRLIMNLAINVAKYSDSVITMLSRYIVVIHELHICRGLCVWKEIRHGFYKEINLFPLN
jgi:hypothetical protein